MVKRCSLPEACDWCTAAGAFKENRREKPLEPLKKNHFKSVI